MLMKVSIIVPSKGCRYLKYLLHELRDQSTRSYEVIVIIDECDFKGCGDNMGFKTSYI